MEARIIINSMIPLSLLLDISDEKITARDRIGSHCNGPGRRFGAIVELNPMCMTPGITKLAQDIGVLTAAGMIIP